MAYDPSLTIDFATVFGRTYRDTYRPMFLIEYKNRYPVFAAQRYQNYTDTIYRTDYLYDTTYNYNYDTTYTYTYTVDTSYEYTVHLQDYVYEYDTVITQRSDTTFREEITPREEYIVRVDSILYSYVFRSQKIDTM